MSAENTPDGANFDPEAFFQQATEDFQDAIDDLPDDPFDRLPAECNVVSDYAAAVGRAVASGLPQTAANNAASMVADNTGMTKTGVLDSIDDAAEAATLGDPDAVAIDVYLRDTVESITATMSTDHHQETSYYWTLVDDGDVFHIETGVDTGTSHYQWQALRSAISDRAGVWTIAPSDAAGGPAGWADFIGPFVNDIREDVTTPGPRTTAVEELQTYVSISIAYATVEHMRENDGVMLNGDPDAEDEADRPTEVHIAAKKVSSICEEIGITTSALHHELDALGYTVDRVNGVSVHTYVNGAPFKRWVLSADFATPARYEPEPQSAVERMNDMAEADREWSNQAGHAPNGSAGAGGDY